MKHNLCFDFVSAPACAPCVTPVFLKISFTEIRQDFRPQGPQPMVRHLCVLFFSVKPHESGNKVVAAGAAGRGGPTRPPAWRGAVRGHTHGPAAQGRWYSEKAFVRSPGAPHVAWSEPRTAPRLEPGRPPVDETRGAGRRRAVRAPRRSARADLYRTFWR